MVSFRSRWLDFSPQTAKYATDKTDKTSCVSFVGEIVDRSEGKTRVSEGAYTCQLCLCADYIIALAQGCANCQGAVCARCGGCKRAQRNDRDSVIPDPFELTSAQVEARDRLLARLREGSQVLVETQRRLLDTRKTEEGIERQFLRWLDAWDGLDYQVRFLYAFKGCVLAPGPCPDDAPIRCRACGKVQP